MKIIHSINHIWHKINVSIVILFVSNSCLANAIIPVSADDQTADNSDFAQTGLSILQKDILPFIEVIGGLAILYAALAGLWKGYKAYQTEREIGPLKEAIISSVIMIVFGGAIIYLLDMLRSWTPAG